MDFEKKVVELDVNDILPNRFQPRIKFNEDSINELCDSIREHGVIQPIVVRKMGDKFEIIAGERRFKASLLAGKMTIPAVVTELNDKDSAEVALIENVQRRDLTPIEEAISYKKILDMGYLTQEDLAIKLGKTQSTVANKLRLLNLTEDVQEALLEEKISERHARSLLKLTNPAQQREMLENIITNRLTVRKTDDAIAKVLKGDSVQEENLNDKVDNISNLNTFDSNSSVNNVSTPDLNDTFNPFTSDISYNNIQNNNNDNYNNQITNNNVNDYKETTLNSNFEENKFGNNFQKPNEFGNFEDTPIQNDFVSPNPSFVPDKDNFEVVNNNYGMNNNEELNSFNQVNNGSFNPFNISQPEPVYDNVDDNDVVPSLEDNDTTEIPVIPTHSYDEKQEEPIIIIDEEPTMNNNNFNNFTNNQNFQNMQQPNGNNEFNPFDMMNTAPQTNNFGIPTSSIENSPIMGNDSFGNTGTQNYGVEEAPVNIPNNNNNVLNPGFMDIDKIKNEAVDINSIINNDNNDGFVAPSNNVNNFDMNGNIDILPTDGPILRPTQPPRNSNVELEPELQPGKFFNLPIEEEVDKNQEVPLESNPFEFNVNGDPSNMTLNTEGQPKLKTLDEVSQFQEPSYDQSFNQMPSMMNQQNSFINPNNNPVNQFGLPIQENYNNGFNYNSNMQVMPNQTQIPPMETQQNMASFMGNTMMSNQLPSNKNMNLAMDAIKECVNKIKSLGFNVNTEDFDFENMYQIMFRIEK